MRWTAPLLALSIGILTPRSPAQCGEWELGFGRRGFDLAVGAFAVYDDGTGPALYVGGNFTRAGGAAIRALARWDGVQWTSVGGSAQGPGADVAELLVHDDGSGPALYAAGTFPSFGGVPANNIARWDGTSWTTLGQGVTGGATARIRRLLVHDDGTGPQLWACGTFTTAGAGQPAAGLARWNGVAWEGMDPGITGAVQAMATYDDGTGPALYVGGGSGIRRWDGNSWTTPSGAPVSAVFALAVHDDGSGPALFAGGGFRYLNGQICRRPVKFDGTSWTITDSPGWGFTIRDVYDFAVHDVGQGPVLFAAGDFNPSDPYEPYNIAYWDGVEWQRVTQSGIAIWAGTDRPVFTIETLDAGRGPELFVGGDFELVVTGGGALEAFGAARFTDRWWPIDTGLGLRGPVRAFGTIAGPDGSELLVGGACYAVSASSAYLLRWSGFRWSSLLEAADPSFYFPVNAVADFAGDLYVGLGDRVGSLGPRPRMLHGDGTAWDVVGNDLDDKVHALATFDDGTGPALYAGGKFRGSAGEVMNHVARWDGAAWQSVGGGLPGVVRVLAVHDDGDRAGPALWAGGDFPGLVARWDGVAWSFPADDNLGTTVRALATWNDGTGAPPRLVAGGIFDRIGGVDAPNLASFDGVEWGVIGGADRPNGPIRAVVEHWPDATSQPALFVGGDGPEFAWFDGAAWHRPAEAFDGTFVGTLASLRTNEGRSLWIGGDFTAVGQIPSSGIARLVDVCAPHHPETRPYCVAKPTSDGCLPFVGSAGIPSVTSPAGFRVEARGVVAGATGFPVYGGQPATMPFHGGTLCVKAPLQRWQPAVTDVAGTGACDGVLGRDFNERLRSGVDPALTAGAVTHLQWRFRDPQDPTGHGDGLTNAIRFVVGP